jgi:sugar phosphate permease
MHEKPTRVRFQVWGALCVAAMLAYMMRNASGAAESTIREQLGLSKEQSGLLISAFFWPYALFQIPAAALSQRIGFARALACFAALWSIACAFLSHGGYPVMVAARICMGVAQAGIVPAGVGMLSRWFPRVRQGEVAGGFAAAMSVGSILTAPLTAWMSVVVGWRAMFVWYAVPGLLWACWFVRWGCNSPREHPRVNGAERLLIESGGMPQSELRAPHPETWKAVLCCAPVFFLCVQQFCRAAGYIFFASWFPTYLQEARGLTLLRSGLLTMLPFLGDVGGSFLGGVISDAVLRRTGSERLARQIVSALAMGMCAVLVWVAGSVESPVVAVTVVSAGMFCAGVGNPCMNAAAMRFGGSQVATLSALANMCGNFGAAAFPMCVPYLLRGAGGWETVLSVFAALYCVAALAWLMVRSPDAPSARTV